jgi:arylsulfatase A-like enzyme
VQITTDQPATAGRATRPAPPGAAGLPRARDLLVLALLGATATAAWHVAVIMLRSRVLGRLTWTSDDLGWMAPVAYLALFALLAVPAALLLRAVPRRGVSLVAVGAVLFLAFGSMLLLVPRVEPLALLLLALGASAALTRRLVDGSNGWRWVRRLTVLSTTVCLLFAADSLVRQSNRDGETLAAGDAPNVLLIILDTVRAANLTVYGYARSTTPALGRLASEGTTYERAFAPAPWTLASHASMFTGRQSSEIRAQWRVPLHLADSTLAELLRTRGYATGGFVANLVYTPREVGLSRGFQTYRDYVRSPRQIFASTVVGQLPWVNVALFDDSVAKRQARSLGSSWRLPQVALTERKTAARVTDEFLQWQGGVGRRPFFAFLNYFDAHAPVVPPAEFATRFGGGATPVDRYDGAISSIDDQLARLFAELRRRGVLDRTLVIVASDHGEQFGEHGLEEHGNSLYTQLLHVPLIMRWPGHVPAGRRVATPVSLRDLGATVLELIGAPATRFPGESFSSLFTTDDGQLRRPLFAAVVRNSAAQPPGPTQFGDMEAIFTGRFHYIRNFGTGREELFDLEADPNDLRDLSGTPVGRDQMASIRALGNPRGGQP